MIHIGTVGVLPGKRQITIHFQGPRDGAVVIRMSVTTMEVTAVSVISRRAPMAARPISTPAHVQPQLRRQLPAEEAEAGAGARFITVTVRRITGCGTSRMMTDKPGKLRAKLSMRDVGDHANGDSVSASYELEIRAALTVEIA